MKKKVIYMLSFSLLNFGCVKKNDGLQSSSPPPNVGGRQSDRDQKQGLLLARELDRMAHSVAQSQLSLKLAMQLVPTLKEKYLPVNEKYVQRMSDEELADAFEKLQSYSVLYAKQKIASSVMDEFIYLKKNASSEEKAKELYFDFSLPFSSGDFSGSDFGSVQQMQITLAEEMLNRQIEKVRNIYLDSLSKEMDIVIEDALVTMDRGAYQNAAKDAGDDEKWEKSELKSLVYEEIDKKLGSLPELFKATLIDHAKEKVQRFLQDHPQLNNKLSDAIAFAGAISKIRTMGKVFEDFDQRRITAAQSISVVGKSIASGLEIVGKEIHDQIQSLDDGQSNIDVAKKGLDSVDEFYRFLKGEIPDPKSKYGAYELSKAYEKAQKDTDQLGQSMSDLATASEDFVVAAERLGIDKDLAKDARKVINALSIGGQFLRNLADNGPLSAVTVAAATVVGAGIPDIATPRHEELLAEFKELRAMSQEMLQLQRKTLESIVALSKQINLQYSNLLVKLDSIEYSVDRANSMLASNEVRILDSCYRRMAYGTRSQ
ncbi:MAG TPA: hypothetical protein PLU50_06785, partial [Pseudobdellovibrionaceae bacterium]|nr:hypothetical protein [Pseudobdellovibrionaceae bacterium]